MEVMKVMNRVKRLIIWILECLVKRISHASLLNIRLHLPNCKSLDGLLMRRNLIHLTIVRVICNHILSMKKLWMLLVKVLPIVCFKNLVIRYLVKFRLRLLSFLMRLACFFFRRIRLFRLEKLSILDSILKKKLLN